MKISCPHCRQNYEVDESYAGQNVQCQNCGNEFMVTQSPILTPVEAPSMKKCPMCGEQILAEARKCKYCGEYLDVSKSCSNSQEDEKIIFSGHPHWCSDLFGYFIGAVLCFIGSIIIIAHAVTSTVAIICTVFFFGLAILTVLITILARKKTIYTLTNKRIKRSWGIFTSNSQTIMIKDIRNLNETQALIQKLFKVGNLELGTAATAGIELVLADLANYKQWKAYIESQMKIRDKA